jgi:AcrR family transcriptional regulator
MARKQEFPASQLKAFADRRRDPDGKREAILRTSVQLFLERSYGRTAMNDIADRLKITKPALYHYFRNKEDILLECYRWGCMLIRERLDEIAARGGTGLEKVADFIRSYTGVITVNFGRAVIRLDDGELSREARAEVRSYKREIDHRLRSFLEEGVRDGSIAPCNSKLAAFSIAGAINWISMWYTPDGQLSAEEIGSNFAKTLTDGLRSTKATTVRRQSRQEPNLRLIQGDAGKGGR